MRESLKRFAGPLGIMFVAGSVSAVAPQPAINDYDSIAPRNIFNLREPPTKIADPVTNAPPINLNLTGITTMLGYKLAMIRTHPATKPGTPPAGTPPAEQTLTLTEGQREGEIEVLQIDEKVGRVRINNAGTIMTLTFEKDGVKPVQALPTNLPVPPSNPPVAAVPTPTGITPPPQSGMVYPGQRRIPSRLNPNGLTPPPVTLPGTTYPAPTNTTSAFVPAQPQTNIAPPSQITPEEQAAISELERELAARTNAATALPNASAGYAATSPPPRTVIAPQ